MFYYCVDTTSRQDIKSGSGCAKLFEVVKCRFTCLIAIVSDLKWGFDQSVKEEENP